MHVRLLVSMKLLGRFCCLPLFIYLFIMELVHDYVQINAIKIIKPRRRKHMQTATHIYKKNLNSFCQCKLQLNSTRKIDRYTVWSFLSKLHWNCSLVHADIKFTISVGTAQIASFVFYSSNNIVWHEKMLLGYLFLVVLSFQTVCSRLIQLCFKV